MNLFPGINIRYGLIWSNSDSNSLYIALDIGTLVKKYPDAISHHHGGSSDYGIVSLSHGMLEDCAL